MGQQPGRPQPMTGIEVTAKVKQSQSFLIVLAGWVFARRRTVTGMIQAAGAVGTKHHSAFHRVFAAARWSLDELGLAVLALVLRLLDPAAGVWLAVADTLARKRGLKVFGVGMRHDPLLSSRARSGNGARRKLAERPGFEPGVEALPPTTV